MVLQFQSMVRDKPLHIVIAPSVFLKAKSTSVIVSRSMQSNIWQWENHKAKLPCYENQPFRNNGKLRYFKDREKEMLKDDSQ